LIGNLLIDVKIDPGVAIAGRVLAGSGAGLGFVGLITTVAPVPKRHWLHRLKRRSFWLIVGKPFLLVPLVKLLYDSSERRPHGKVLRVL